MDNLFNPKTITFDLTAIMRSAWASVRERRGMGSKMPFRAMLADGLRSAWRRARIQRDQARREAAERHVPAASLAEARAELSAARAAKRDHDMSERSWSPATARRLADRVRLALATVTALEAA